MRKLVQYGGVLGFAATFCIANYSALAQDGASNSPTHLAPIPPIAQPQPKPKLDPNLLHWQNTNDSNAALTDTPDDVFWDKDIRKRYSLYGANLYSVNLDVSVALKPGRLMSLDAAW
jgi:hypothetical protein